MKNVVTKKEMNLHFLVLTISSSLFQLWLVTLSVCVPVESIRTPSEVVISRYWQLDLQFATPYVGICCSQLAYTKNYFEEYNWLYGLQLYRGKIKLIESRTVNQAYFNGFSRLIFIKPFKVQFF